MKKTVVITDSDASLPPELATKHNIFQVPILVNFDNQSFTTGVDIDDKLLFEKVDQLKKLPTTSAPSPSAFQSAYEKAFNDGADSIITVCVSSKISSTYASAVTACEAFPGRDISVIDSLNVSMGQGFMALTAAEALARGAAKDEAIELIDQTGKHVILFAVLPTLKYLAMSGRVGKLVAGMADTLNIKPILTMKEGKLVLLERIRTRSKAIERMLELVHTSLNGHPIARASVIHACNLEGATDLQNILRSSSGCPEDVIIAPFTAGLSVHAGAGLVGIVIIPKF